MHLWVTRGEPDASRQAERVAGLGHSAIVEPLLTITFDDRVELRLDGVQGLIATSRNGLRALARRPVLDRAREMPLFVVGPASAALGRELGFGTIHEGTGTAEGLLDVISANCTPDAGRLLHLAGATLASDLKGALASWGFALDQPALYKARRRAGLSPALREAITSDRLDGVLLMSPRTATIYVDLMESNDLGDDVRSLGHYCLSAGVAERLAPLRDIPIHVARGPREDDLLALLDGGPAK